MLKSIAGSVLLILLVLSVLAGIGFKKYQMMTAPPPPHVEHPEMVVFAKPESASIRKSTTTVGTVLAPRSVQLRTEVSGTVANMSFAPGQVVDADQLLLKLDTSVEEAQLAGAQAAMKIAESTLKRTKQAADMRAISELELEQASAIMSQARADVMRLEATIRKKTLRAPFCARAGLFEIQVGQYLPEGTQITMLQGIDNFVLIDFMMPQQAADELHVGDEIRLAIEPNPYMAKIIAVDSQADRVTRNVMARARLDQPPASMQPNDSVRIEMEYGAAVEASTIPAAGLRRSPTGAFVYVVLPDQKDSSKMLVHAQNVVPSKTIGQRVALLSGLALNDTIVSDGSFKLREGMWVTNANASPSGKPDVHEVVAP
jgi:membrane fusion protein, multidrug efflux system